MTEHEASRTLVKSPPELWAECSDAASLARHLGQFGDITITRLDPEIAVAWEGERASGTVRLEPAGWGTKVVLTATPFGAQEPPAQAGASPAPAEPRPVAVAIEPEPASADPEPRPAEVETDPEPAAVATDPEPGAVETDREPPAPAPPRERPVPRLGGFARLRRWLSGGPAQLDPSPEPADAPAPVLTREPEPIASESEPVSAPEPEPADPPAPLLVPEPDPELDPEREPGPAVADVHPTEILTAALDSLGQAHHRPYSRS